MMKVRKAEQNQWSFKPAVEDHKPVEEQENEINKEDDDMLSEYIDEIDEDQPELQDKSTAPEEHLQIPAKYAKRHKLSTGLPSSIKFTSFELQFDNNNVVELNVVARTMFRKEDNFVFDISFLNHRNDKFLYKCKFCVKAFANSEFLVKHVCSVHLCIVCLGVSETYKELHKHLQEHLQVNCPFCNKICDSPASFRQHLKKQHLLKLPNSYIGILPQ
jgi:hypothetical protein